MSKIIIPGIGLIILSIIIAAGILLLSSLVNTVMIKLAGG